MRGHIFSNTETASADRFALQNSKMLKVTLNPQSGPEVLARSGAMVAYQGAVDFDYEMAGYGQMARMAQTGQGIALMRCSGFGEVFFANLAADVHVLKLTNDGLTVSGQNVLAFDANLQWDVSMVQSAVNIAGVGSYQVQIQGQGSVAVTTSGHPLMLRVTPGSYTFADADAVVAWTSGLRTTMQSAVTQGSAFSRRGNTGETWQMQFQGDGFVVVQPSELLPPALLYGGLASQFGVNR